MRRRSRGGALLFGLILIAIGVIFFCENLYGNFSAWQVIARYWPLILIFIGIKKLYGYFIWQEIGPVSDNAPKE